MIGTTVLHYKILEKLGGGGMGVVYKAEDTRLGRIVALKFLPQDLTRDDEAKLRFIQEARTASALDHPNICGIHDIHDHRGRMFISMSCYEGETTKHRIQRGQLPILDAVNIGIGVALGLVKAHSQNIIHRDIKPANIYLTDDGQVKILDFGLAKLAGQTTLTTAGTVMGTVSYMSPEQARGEDIDHRTDIWSLGVVLYEMITGRLPFASESPEVALYSICNEEPKLMTDFRDDIPIKLAAIVTKCLKKDRDKRYADAQELGVDLIEVKRQIDTGTSAILTRRSAGFRRYKRLIVRYGFPVLILLLAFLVFHPAGRNLIWPGGDSGGTVTQKYVALLPFKSSGAAPADRVFFDGLSEYLTLKLSQLQRRGGHLWTISSNQVHDLDADRIDEACTETGANCVLAGEVTREGDLIRLNLDLIDAENGETIDSWATSQRMGSVRALQYETVIKLAEMLEVQLEPEMLSRLVASGTTVPAAFQSFIEGLGYMILPNDEDLSDVDKAIACFEEAIDQDSSYVMAHAWLGSALWSKCLIAKDPNCSVQALECLEHAIELEDRLPDSHTSLGLIHKSAGRHEEAVREFEKALELDPVNQEALTQLAGTYEAMKDLSNAERVYREAIEIRPGYWVCYGNLGFFYRMRGRYEEAAEQFRKAIGIAPGNSWAHKVLGIIYYDMGRMDESVAMFERANELAPSYTGYANLATIYFVEGRYSDAARMYEVALALDDSDYQLWGNLGSSYLWIPGQRDKALDAYREAIRRGEALRKIQPNDWMLLCLLGGYYAELDERDRALELTERALELAPQVVDVMFQAGHNYEVLGERELALEWIGSALEHGYSLEQIESTPALNGLCEDERYKTIAERRQGSS
jgi:serine/threonine-protein kinase